MNSRDSLGTTCHGFLLDSLDLVPGTYHDMSFPPRSNSWRQSNLRKSCGTEVVNTGPSTDQNPAKIRWFRFNLDAKNVEKETDNRCISVYNCVWHGTLAHSGTHCLWTCFHAFLSASMYSPCFACNVSHSNSYAPVSYSDLDITFFFCRFHLDNNSRWSAEPSDGHVFIFLGLTVTFHRPPERDVVICQPLESRWL